MMSMLSSLSFANVGAWFSSMRYALLLPGLAWWMVFVLPLLAVCVGAATGRLLRKQLYQPWLLSSFALAYVIIAAGMFVLPQSLYGRLDENCGYYQNGDAVFVLEHIYKTQIKASDSNIGPKQYVFMVRAPKLFGDEVHTCVVSAAKAGELMEQLYALAKKAEKDPEGDGYNRSRPRFSFRGGIQQNPNVLIPPGQYRGAKGPPDPPVRKYDM